MAMKAFVNDACIGCGLCVGICPEVFHMNDAGLAEAVSQEIETDVEGQALEAQDGCPVNAIEVK